MFSSGRVGALEWEGKVVVKGEQHEQRDPVEGSHNLLVFLHHRGQVGCVKASVNLGLGPLVLQVWYKLP